MLKKQSDSKAHNGDQYWTGDYTVDGTNNAFFQIQFMGTKIELYSKTAHWHGIGVASIDNGPEVDVDFSSPNEVYQALVYTSPNLALGTHTLKMRTTGRTLGYPAREAFLTTDYAKVYDDNLPVDPPLIITPELPAAVGEIIEAEKTTRYYNLTINKDCDDDGAGKKISWIETSGAWAGYFVDLGTGARGIDIRVSTENANGGIINIRKNGYLGPVIGSLTIPGGMGWTTYNGAIEQVTGKDTLYLSFQGNGSYPHFDVNWLRFTAETTQLKLSQKGNQQKSSQAKQRFFGANKDGINSITAAGRCSSRKRFINEPNYFPLK